MHGRHPPYLHNLRSSADIRPARTHESDTLRTLLRNASHLLSFTHISGLHADTTVMRAIPLLLIGSSYAGHLKNAARMFYTLSGTQAPLINN